MQKKTLMISVLISVIVIVTILSSITMITSDVIGANITNDTLVSKVFVWNTEPNLYNVTVTPSVVNLEPGNTTQVNCTGYVFDYNGWEDIQFINSTLFHSSSSNEAADDNNDHYTNSTGSCSQDGSSSTNATCLASFMVWYYATNGTWTCTMEIGDQGGNATERLHYFNTSRNGSTAINTVLALDVPEEIDYGNLSVTEISNNISVNITNWGNVPINISVRGWGGTGATNNLSMICDLGNITVGYQRYTPNSSIAYTDMLNLTNITTGINNFDLPIRTNDSQYDTDRNTTYWRLQVPLSIGGNCNGTVEFSATQTN